MIRGLKINVAVDVNDFKPSISAEDNGGMMCLFTDTSRSRGV